MILDLVAVVLLAFGLLYLVALVALGGWLFRTYFGRVPFGSALVFFALVLASSTCQAQDEPSKLFRALGLATYGVSAGDVVSTELALSNGYAELNPMQRDRAVRIGTHVAWVHGWNHVTDNLYRDGHHKTALWLRISMVAAMGYATARNVRNATR